MAERTVGFFRKLRMWLVTGVLFVALSMLNFFLGCDKEKEDPKPLYGVPPDGLTVDGQGDIYVDPGVDVPRVYYGPMPGDIDEQDGAEPDSRAGDDAVRVLYGVPDAGPVDDAQETPDGAIDDSGMRVFYGPMPTDVGDEDLSRTSPDQMRTYYGPMPVDIVQEDLADDAADAGSPNWYGPAPLYGAQPN